MTLTFSDLKQRQSLPLEAKIQRSKQKIREFYRHNEGQVYVAFSGGKDSTVLLDLVRSVYSDVHAVFVDTGLEYPEIKDFVRTVPDTIILRPAKTFPQVLKEDGFPVVSKKVSRMIRTCQNPTSSNEKSRRLYFDGINQRGEQSKLFTLPQRWKRLVDAPFKISEKCCDHLKKNPAKRYDKESGRRPIIGTMACDSKMRQFKYMETGCNNFTANASTPIAFWRQEDIWDYIHQNNISYCPIYDMGEKHTGCMFCMFGLHLEKHPDRFERMAISHPQLYDYCMNKLGLCQVIDFVNNGAGGRVK